MSFWDTVKNLGMSKQEGETFKVFVQKAKKSGYNSEEILDAWENKKSASKETIIRAPDATDVPPPGSIRAPMSSADRTASILSRGKPTTFTKEALEYAPEVAGATALTVAGGPVTIPGAMALAALGGAGGRGIQSATRSLTGSSSAPLTPGEAAVDVAKAGARQGIAEGFGRAIIKGIGKVWEGGWFKPSEISGKTIPKKVETKEALLSGKETPTEILKKPDVPEREAFEAFGGRYTAAQMTNSRVIDVLDNMARGSFFGGGVMDATFHAQQKTLKEMGDVVSDSIIREGLPKLSDRQIGQLFVDTVQDGRTAFKTSAEKLFHNVDDIVYQGMQMASPEGNAVRKSVEGYSMPEVLKMIKEMPAEKFKKEVGDSVLKMPNGDYFIPNSATAREVTDKATEADWHEFMDMGVQSKFEINGVKGVIFRWKPWVISEDIRAGSEGGLRAMDRFEGLIKYVDAREVVGGGKAAKGVDPFTRIKPKKPSESGYVNVQPAVERAQEYLADLSRLKNIGKGDVGGRLLDSVAALNSSLTFGDAQLLRSNLLDVLREAQARGESRAVRTASELAGIVDKQMETAAKNLSGDALNAWRDANKFYKFGKTNFDNDFIRKLTTSDKVNWSEVGDLVFRSGDDDAVRTARKAIRSAEFTTKKAGAESPVDFNTVWRQMQAGYYEGLLRKNMDPITGALKPEGLLRDLANRKTERTVKAAFSNDQLNAIRNFAKVAHLANPENASKSGVNMVQWAQGGAILSLANPLDLPEDIQGYVQKVGGGILLGPYVIAKMLTNPMSTRWLIQGIKTPISSGASGGLSARLGLAAIQAAQNKISKNEGRYTK
jgi:hypothetical protein